MKECSVCKKAFDPETVSDEPAVQAGEFLARQLWDDEGTLCPRCLANRGVLGMMYCRELD